MRSAALVIAICAAAAGAAAEKGPAGTYDGNVAGRYRIRMTLARDGEALSGSYLYEEAPASSLTLGGKVEKDGTFSLRELDKQGKETGVFVGMLNRDKSISGRRTRPDGTARLGFYGRPVDPTKATLNQAPGRFEGSWSWEEDGNTFRLDLLHRGSVVEGFYQASQGARTERDSLVVGNISGGTGIVDWTSGHSGKKGSARLTAQSNTVHWRILDTPAAEFFAPARATLRRVERD